MQLLPFCFAGPFFVGCLLPLSYQWFALRCAHTTYIPWQAGGFQVQGWQERECAPSAAFAVCARHPWRAHFCWAWAGTCFDEERGWI